MSTTAAALIVAAVLAFSLPAAFWQIRRAARAESAKGRLIREVHEMADTAQRWDSIALAWDLPAYGGADLDAGLDRLRAAIREEQTNTTEGD